MDITPSNLRLKYDRMTPEELLNKFEKLKSEYDFNTKQAFVKDYVNHYLYLGREEYIKMEKQIIEELLAEKIKKDTYLFEKTQYIIELEDLIDYYAGVSKSMYGKISNFLNALDIKYDDKMKFLVELYQDKESYDEFSEEILKDNIDYNDIYTKYKTASEEYVKRNRKSMEL